MNAVASDRRLLCRKAYLVAKQFPETNSIIGDHVPSNSVLSNFKRFYYAMNEIDQPSLEFQEGLLYIVDNENSYEQL